MYFSPNFHRLQSANRRPLSSIKNLPMRLVSISPVQVRRYELFFLPGTSSPMEPLLSHKPMPAINSGTSPYWVTDGQLSWGNTGLLPGTALTSNSKAREEPLIHGEETDGQPSARCFVNISLAKPCTPWESPPRGVWRSYRLEKPCTGKPNYPEQS